MSVEVREAAPGDRPGVRQVLDAAMLVVREDLAERIDAGDVLVASETAATPRDADDADPTVVGALVLVPRSEAAGVAGGEDADSEDANGGLDSEDANGGLDSAGDGDGAHVDAVAVRRARRGRGIGSALVRAAAERHAPLTAEFDPDVRPFYESLDFDVSDAPGDDDRLLGRFDATEG